MKRRSFFKTAAIGGAAFTLSPLAACDEKNNQAASSTSDYTQFDLNEVTVAQLQQKMKSGELTAEQLTNKYLKRIKEVDQSGPTLRTVIELNPDAVAIARKMDEERKAGKLRGPLHGIPILIKDNIDTGDKMQTTAGSLALEGNRPQNDAFIVSKLREAGAVLLGKTNLSEWANFRSNHSSSGWSGRGGQTCNPYVTDRSPCGSSSGSGAGVSANFSAIAIGTETDGSIVCPSGINGVVGIKPTVGLWSRHGIIPISHSQDTAGPMARTVTDAATLLGPLVGDDANDRATMNASKWKGTDYTQFLDKNGLNGARIGIVKDYFGFNDDVDALMKLAMDAMKQQGAELVELEPMKDHDQWSKAEWTVLVYEFKNDLNKYLAEHPEAPRKNLKELIEFNKKNSSKELQWFGQSIFITAEEKTPSEEEYLNALKLTKTLPAKYIDGAMKEHNLNALIAPTNGPSWTIDRVNGDHFGGGSSDLAAVSGYPSITVPAGFVHELPIGLSFIGTAWSEPELIKLAYSFEQATKLRQAPKFIPSLLNQMGFRG